MSTIRLSCMLALATPMFLAVACAAETAADNSLNYGLTLSPTGIDPHLNASVELGIPLSSVYDTLVFHDPETGGYVAGLAKSWEISADGRTYTFRLRDDVTFHDGQRFDAEAVAANIDYILNPDHHSQKAAALLGPLERVEVLDRYQVALHLDQPFAPLLDSLSQVYLGMASPLALETRGPSQYQFHQVGTGPYRFVEYLPNDHLTLERNPDYGWAPSHYRSQQASIERVTFLFFEDPATRALALESGQVDIIGELPPHEAERISELREFELLPVRIPGQPLQLIFNTQRMPTDEALVREALVLAVDREAVVNVVFGGFSPVAQNALASGTLGAAAPVDRYPYDPAAAAALMEAAGWIWSPQDQLRSRDGQPLELQLVVPPWGSNPEVAQLVVGYWEAIGARVMLQVAPGYGPLTQTQAEGNYQVIGFNTFGSDPDLLRPFFRSDGFFNWSGYADPLLDDLLSQAAAETSSLERRLELYREIQALVNEQALILPLRDYVNLVGVHSSVEGLRFSTQGWFPYLIEIKRAP